MTVPGRILLALRMKNAVETPVQSRLGTIKEPMKTPVLSAALSGAILTFPRRRPSPCHNAADNLDVWRWRNPLPNDSTFFQVQFLNGQFFGYGLSAANDTPPPMARIGQGVFAAV